MSAGWLGEAGQAFGFEAVVEMRRLRRTPRMKQLLGIAAVIGAGIGNLPAAPPALLLDLASPGNAAASITRIYGSTGTGRHGVPVCGGLDCNGDGFQDVAFSQLVASPSGRVNCGMVTVIFGSGQLGAAIDTAGFTNNILKLIGDADHEITGAEIWMEDLNRDGLGDILIGRQNFSPEPARAGAGALTIVFGSTNLTSAAGALSYFDLRRPPTNISVITIVGETAYDRLGIWMRTGDVDGDGDKDLVVGADEREDTGRPLTENSGAIYVLRGGSHWDSVMGTVDLAQFGMSGFPAALQGQVAMVLPPTNSVDAHFGATCSIGDLDGNGRAEVLACATINRAGAALRLPGAPIGTGEATGGLGTGALFIAWDENFPDGPWPGGYQFRVDKPMLGDFTRIDGGPTNGAFGEEMLAGRDYSADGYQDLFVSDLVATGPNGAVSGMGYVLWNAARLRGQVFSIASPPANVEVSTVFGPSQGAIGADTVAAGDFDNDGIDDLAVGNPHDSPQGRPSAGTVHVLYGQPGGWPATIDLRSHGGLGPALPATAEMRITQIDAAKGTDGANRPDTLSYSAAAGDLNGDGYTDLIANEMIGDGLSPAAVDAGNLLLISGTALIPNQTSELVSVLEPPQFGAWPLRDQSIITADIVVSNRSGGDVSLGVVELQGAGKGVFSIQADSGEGTLAPGQIRTVTVRFHPIVPGRNSAHLLVVGPGLPLRVPVSGQVFDPLVRPVLAVGRITASGDLLFFGSQLGLGYDFQRSTDLNAWLPVRTNLPGTGGILSLRRLAPAVPEFFRVVGRP